MTGANLEYATVGDPDVPDGEGLRDAFANLC
jgi:hypothetical protein